LKGIGVAKRPLFAERGAKNSTLVVIAGDGGLCCTYNNFLIKRAAGRLDELKAAGYNANATNTFPSWDRAQPPNLLLLVTLSCKSSPKISFCIGKWG